MSTRSNIAIEDPKTKKIKVDQHNKITNKIKDKEYINALYKIVDKLEQRISKLEKMHP